MVGTLLLRVPLFAGGGGAEPPGSELSDANGWAATDGGAVCFGLLARLASWLVSSCGKRRPLQERRFGAMRRGLNELAQRQFPGWVTGEVPLTPRTAPKKTGLLARLEA